MANKSSPQFILTHRLVEIFSGIIVDDSISLLYLVGLGVRDNTGAP